jgi:hypothetical protein
MIFADRLVPDELVARTNSDPKDEAMLAARSWLLAQCNH